MKNSEAALIGQAAALVVLSSFREQINDVVRHELPLVVKAGTGDGTEFNNTPAPLRREIFNQTEYKASSNYSQVLLASARWRKGRGSRLGSVWMFKPGTQERLLVEQYEQECSVMRMDKAAEKAEFDSINRMTKPGSSIWGQFDPMKGVIEDVTAKLETKGWKVETQKLKHQLALVDAR